MRTMIVLAFLLLCGACATMQEKVAENIALGAEREKVHDLLGSPDAFSHEYNGVNNIVVWSYVDAETHCSFKFIQDIVSQYGCEPVNNPKYKGISALHRVMQNTCPIQQVSSRH